MITFALCHLAILILAQVPSETLVNGGLASVMLGWLMFRVEKRMKNMEVSQDRGARATALLVIALDSPNQSIQAQAKEIIAEIDRKKVPPSE